MTDKTETREEQRQAAHRALSSGQSDKDGIWLSYDKVTTIFRYLESPLPEGHAVVDVDQFLWDISSTLGSVTEADVAQILDDHTIKPTEEGDE